MFVLIADIQGSHITVAYGYLPDKKQMSYALFLYLILDAFEAYQEDFRAITGRIHLKLRVIVSDYEVSIHLAFRDFFLMRGCYFHWSQVTLIQYSLGPVKNYSGPVAKGSGLRDGDQLCPQSSVQDFCQTMPWTSVHWAKSPGDDDRWAQRANYWSSFG